MSSTKGLIGNDFQSSNTLRNSLSPITIGKDRRFRVVLVGGAHVPFHDVKRTLDDPENLKNTRWNFSYTKRSVFNQSNYSFIPSPDHYYGKTMTQFRQEKDYKKCTFGESYEQIKPRVDIDNRKILSQITFERVGPSSYTPMP